MSITPAQIEKAYATTSEHDFDVIDEFDVEKRVETIARLYRLTQEQTDSMSMATMMLAMNGADQEDFFSELADVGLTGIQAKELEKEINDVILDPLREEIEASKADIETIEETGSDIEIIDEAPREETISKDEEQKITTTERTLLASDGVVVEDEQIPTEITVQASAESRDQILVSLENPQKSEGVALDKIVPKQEPTHTTSIPIRATPTFFETGPMGPSPMPVSPPLQGGVAEGRGGFSAEQTTPNPSYDKEGNNPPEGLPIESDKPTTPVINTIPITTTPIPEVVEPQTPPIQEKKRIENPGPIAINIPTPIIEKTIPIATVVEPAPVVVIKEATPPQATPPQEVPTTPSAPKEPVFKDIPKVNIVDVGSIAPSKEPEGNPLEQPELLKAAQEHLRQLARERQKGFIAQKMTTTFSLPKTETTVGAAPSKIPQPSSDPYKETL